MVERDHRIAVEEVQTPLLENMVVGVPPVFEGLTREINQLVEQPLLGPRTEFPPGELSLCLRKDEINVWQHLLH